MRILLIGEASYLHNTLKKGLVELGHEVTLMSDGNDYHDSPRDIDVARNLKHGKLGGLFLLLRLLFILPRLRNYDVVQLVHPIIGIPLRPWLNSLIVRKWLKRHNKCLVVGAFGDDSTVIRRQQEGALEYSDTYWNGKPQNQDKHQQRIESNLLPEVRVNEAEVMNAADAIVPCLYEYNVCYDIPEYRDKLHYIGLPIDIGQVSCKRIDSGRKIKVLVGIQPKRDYIKGAGRIAEWLRWIAVENPDRIEITEVEGVPYDEYCELLANTDVLVDQLYSYTPSMNSLAAMARGTVVIGGAEEEYYRFIGENTLRPIINVRPDSTDEENINVMKTALFTPGNLERMSRESILFARKYHDYRIISREYENLYKRLVQSCK